MNSKISASRKTFRSANKTKRHYLVRPFEVSSICLELKSTPGWRMMNIDGLISIFKKLSYNGVLIINFFRLNGEETFIMEVETISTSEKYWMDLLPAKIHEILDSKSPISYKMF